jgi:ABC-type transport system substrate-binding protein/DNA-binding beta-propeller fold protein YncE
VDVTLAQELLDASRPRDALALWRGEPLCDLADEPFAPSEIRRLVELRLRAAELAIDADLEAGRHDDVIGELDALVAAHPLRERLHAQRMLALYRAGRQSEALEAYGDARAALVGEIGVEPGAELQRLQEAILAHDPALELRAAAGDTPETAPRPPPHRSSTRILIGAAAIFLAGVLAFGVIRVLGPGALAGIHEDHVGRIDPESGRITAEYAVGHSPGAMTSGGGSVWVANRLDGTVSRIDRKRDELVAISVGGAPSALAFSAGSLWVTDGDSRDVVQVAPGANKVVRRVAVGNAPRSVAAAAGALWVVSGVDGSVHRIELGGDGEALRSIPIGAIPTAITAGAGALWVSSEESGTVTRIEPRTGAIVSTINVGHGPGALAVGEGAVWVVNRYDGTLSRIDPTRNAVSGSVGIGDDPTAVTVGGGSVWVAGGEAGTVARVDPDGPRLLERRKTGSSPSAMAFAGGALWTAATAPQAAHRGGTLRVLVPAAAGISIDWVDEAGYNPVTAQVTSLVYDGLVAYRRVSGAAGATLVGALATAAPAPTADGRTYSFTLRPGVRYSDGRLVQPEDFRASIERFLHVTGRGLFPPYYEGIVGARRCMRRAAARCDLSRGIETDRRARTITVHLTRPDGEFLHKLTVMFAYVVPSATPARRLGNQPPPGTGPYRIARWDARRGGTLVRNPYFKPWSPQARPAGFADRIEIRARPEKNIEPLIREVQRDRADVTTIANPFGSSLGRERLAALAATSPGQLHSAPQPATEWMFLNTRRRPFDDLGVRRAINLATDRARIVELMGGPEVAVAACQIVPTAFPGHEPYCPYSAGSTASGEWTGPDIGRARRLVRESGRAGARVVVHVPGFRRDVGRYFVALLDDLGFRASLAPVLPVFEYFPKIQDPHSRAQMGFVGWTLDYVSGTNFLDGPFTCPSASGGVDPNESRFCDRRLIRDVRRARVAAPADAVRAVAAADHRLTDLAPAVPMTNQRVAVFVSKRVGNVQHHPQWFTLLDQMWVR